MAARSPNVRLQKALSRRAASKNIKCPLTVPAKSSKSRLSKLAAVSNIPRKLIEDKEKISHPSKSISTPKIKGKQVASKYLTTPRNKKCIQNPNSFRSVQNQKPAALDVPKNRTIAKALVFHSPKKAICLKKSVELRTPLTKLCQGIKKLEITDKKKRLLDYSVKSKDSKCNGDPLKKNNSQKDKSATTKSTIKSQTRVAKEARTVHSTNTRSELAKQCHSKNKVENVCSKPGIDLTSTDSSKERATVLDNLVDSIQPETNVSSALPLPSTKNLLPSSDTVVDELNCDADQRALLGNDLLQGQVPSEEAHNGTVGNGTEENSATRTNTMDHSFGFQTSEGEAARHDSDMNGDDKENISVPNENSLANNMNQAGQKVLGLHKMQKVIKKNAQPLVKNLKDGLLSMNAGASGIKSKKPKSTNPKPFRLRTDERGILREADLQRKKQGNVKYPENENRCTEDNPNSDGKGLQNDLLKESGIKSNKTLEAKVRLRKSSATPERSPASQSKAASLRNAKSPMSSSCLRQGRKLTAIQEASAEISKPNEIKKLHENGAAAMPRVKASRTLSRGRRPLTIPKEPHFHSTHMPKSCTRNLAAHL